MGLFNLFRGESPRLVEQASEHVHEMLEDGHRMFVAASASVLDNEILDLDLERVDEHINEREQRLRRAVLEHLASDPKREMVFCLKLVSIVHEAERIGDLAKSLATTGRLAKKPRMGELVEPLRGMRDRIVRMFDRAQKGFAEGEPAAARALMLDHERMKDDVAEYLKHLADREDITANEGMVYALSVRLMGRVSSHLANIASTVVLPFDQIQRAPKWLEQDA